MSEEYRFKYKYWRPAVSADNVVFRFDGRRVLVLLVRRGNEPFRGCWALPGGFADEGETIERTAARELEEETGFRPGRMTKLARILTAVAWGNEATDIYLAEDLKRISSQHLDEAEEIELCAFTLEELCRRIYAGEIQDAKTVAGIMAYRSRLAQADEKDGTHVSASGSDSGDSASRNDSDRKYVLPETMADKLRRILRRARTG